jgi:hypothetical protein
VKLFLFTCVFDFMSSQSFVDLVVKLMERKQAIAKTTAK